MTGVYLYCNNFWYVRKVSIFHFTVLIPGAYSPLPVPTIRSLYSLGPERQVLMKVLGNEERPKMELMGAVGRGSGLEAKGWFLRSDPFGCYLC